METRKHFSLRAFLKEEVTGWKPWELAWLAFAVAVILALSILGHDSALGMIMAGAGVACVVFTGKGKPGAYVFGTVNVTLYAFVAFRAAFYGEAVLNALYYLPMGVVGFIRWSRSMDAETGEVEKRRMARKAFVLTLCGAAAAVLVYGWVLQKIGGSEPYLDALCTVLSVLAMIAAVNMYAEQWILHLFSDSAGVALWAIGFAHGQGNIATLVMWSIYVLNSCLMLAKWLSETKKALPDGRA